MLGTIFNFETKRWFKNWQFYLYFILFFALSFGLMAGAIGYFDALTVTTSSNTVMNSPIAISSLMGGIVNLLNFIIPVVIGTTVYRDFKYNTHTLLFAYPFNKFQYLIGKFLSGFLITVIITFSIGLGFLLATLLPFANPDLLGPINLSAYFQSYLIFVLPNIFFIGALIFMLVTLTRNQYIGFIFVIVLLFIPAIIGSLTTNVDDKFVASLLEPFGNQALSYVTKYWTIDEQNTLLIPLDDVIIYNRLIWIGVGVLALVATYFSFSFSQSPITIGRKRKAERITKNNFGSIIKINLPKVSYSYSFISNLKTAFRLSKFEFKSIVKNWIFISLMIILLIFILVSSYSLGEMFGTKTYPVTWKVIDLVKGNLDFFLSILVFLFSGVLLNNATSSRMNLLIDSTPVPNWSLLLSKFIALVEMVCVVFLVGILSGVLIQAYLGYYNFELGQYFSEFFGLQLIDYVILILLSLFIQAFFRNYFIGFFIIFIVVQMLPFAIGKLGIEQAVFHLNSDPGYSYSDMDGYGTVRGYFYYKLYWLLFGFVLYGLTLLFWRRGILSNAKERVQLFVKRFKPAVAVPLVVALLAFVGLGSALYYQEVKLEPYYTAQEYEKQQVDFEKKYKKFEKHAQPRIVDVKVDMDIYPNQRNYKAVVNYVMVNKSDKAIDSLFINYGKNLKKITFGKDNKRVLNDTVMKFDIYRLNQPLNPGDSLKVQMVVENKSNTWLQDRSPIIENGTFINNGMFPSFGYSDSAEIQDNDVRKKYNLAPRERMAATDDPEARKNTYISNEADWITFETTVSTAGDQTAIAPGYLQKQWQKDGRNYFHYKMDQKMLNFYAFNSARYEVKKEKWNNLNLEIYYHKGHEYNLDRMMDALKKSLAYYSENFGEYQHKQARIIEFPRTMGTFAQAFANTMPFSEAIGFIADVDSEDPDAVDYPFSVVSHEMAHQWWAHQVIGANVKGATLLSESLSEYSSLKVLEKEYGKFQMRKFLKDALDNYLMGRTREWKEENPLMYNENQQYIHYNKGSLVLYAMSDYLGEKRFNDILKAYVSQVKFQEAPYTNSIEFVNHLKANTPANLQYLITDMFETITLYDNKVDKVELKPLKDGKYQVDISFIVSKYRTSPKGTQIYKDAKGNTLVGKDGKKEVKSYPLNDYVEVGVFGEKTIKGSYEYENELHNKKYLINKVNNKVSIIVDKKPVEVGVDPYNKLIDRDSNDNRKKVN
ncbi:ABC transporter permease/M1 family aminopeptidase [Paenimyroides baculatum]|uniref:ABC transporter permease/M1 family aminopeptidase n=1 Tax=Paenimyroides baculatum TaxID=2608000 RepID=UPI0016816D59|nr:M1 family aminopeptidase [Paenimyroides baculatum]